MKIKLFLIYSWFYFTCLSIGQTISINASDGSFKLQGFKGEIVAYLTGSCLIHDLKGNICWNGKWTKVYTKGGRSIYKGKGKVKIKGEGKVIQFLGQSIRSKVSGTAKIILYPSLMQNTKDNFYKYDKEKESHKWGLFSLDTIWLPKR